MFYRRTDFRYTEIFVVLVAVVVCVALGVVAVVLFVGVAVDVAVFAGVGVVVVVVAVGVGVSVIVAVVVGVLVVAVVGVGVGIVALAVVVAVVVGLVVVVAVGVVVVATAEFSCNTEYTQLETRRRTLARFEVVVVVERLLSHDRLIIFPTLNVDILARGYSMQSQTSAYHIVSYHIPQFCQQTYDFQCNSIACRPPISPFARTVSVSVSTSARH